ncbi:Response regulator c-di-GMP phosphodiesterase, RpfG family, contains REC and HD-GYP domains [Desulfonauticus submarinus]|uniref:Response regulator c-di-GMP phosphodiesterase, RpfG family, contains REC and HD-GYP domains n=1 Tax=Desulfonauticus submarinus TaxID=206665 RepID=A0A1G9ZUQ6_9BACT|nr:HD domain-containing phosphohydrolase [Desulfonauticus submarinus]SDN24276.1 Response regulator c-di-GMP phosphodiesterase, RpfG family, contains REC and HD-GYP domains [Desulfonauticus submarinus]
MILEKILFVDDDTKILDGFRRTLRKKFRVETAVNGMQALKILNKDKNPYAVVVADLKMPQMNGLEFLVRVKELFPSIVRMMLTGHGDLDDAIQAINSGEVFRFLVKPVKPKDLEQALLDGVKYYRLQKTEKELLEKTLKGVIDILVDILNMTNDEALGRASRIKRYVRDVAITLGEIDIWKYETAALLSQIGCIILPPEVIKKVRTGERLEGEEYQLYMQHPFIASDLLKKIPRMEEVAEIIAYQQKNYDGTGFPLDPLRGDKIPLGARILRFVLDFDLHILREKSKKKALNKMLEHKSRYDPKVFKAFLEVVNLDDEYKVRVVTVEEVIPYMIFIEDIYSLNGMLLLKKGHEVTPALAEKLRFLDKTYGIKQPLKVLVPPKFLIEKRTGALTKGSSG